MRERLRQQSSVYCEKTMPQFCTEKTIRRLGPRFYLLRETSKSFRTLTALSKHQPVMKCKVVMIFLCVEEFVWVISSPLIANSDISIWKRHKLFSKQVHRKAIPVDSVYYLQHVNRYKFDKFSCLSDGILVLYIPKQA